MVFTINAWLDKPSPELSVVENETGKVVANWSGQALRRLFSTGVISYQELSQANKHTLKQMVQRLILEYAAQQMDATGVKSSF
ncbi:hypothetical protein [Kangiella sp. TOML190]|uniref:hypothetical protein n=1 Tax=Kangiella sp. TOML190 TaxID=2931351 RepID=UPI00203EAAFE|nr:hypothetical protein [Kangiella sp. TOML190]